MRVAVSRARGARRRRAQLRNDGGQTARAIAATRTEALPRFGRLLEQVM